MNSVLKGLPTEPLSPAREQELFLAGDTEAVLLHTLVHAIKYLTNSRPRYPGRPASLAEKLSMCYAALSKSIRTFKPGMKSFLAYSKPFLRGEMCRYWRDKNVVRDAFRHEAPEQDEFPKPLTSEHVEADFETIHWREVWTQVEPVIRKTLKPIEIRVLEYRYKYDMTLEETGEQIGRTRERVRQLETEAMEKLRGVLSSGLKL